MLCGPAPRAVAAVVRLAWPPLRSAVPRVKGPSANVTAPPGVPPVQVAVAVNVTGWPYTDGLAEDVTCVLVCPAVTVTVSGAEVLAPKPAPTKVAVTVCGPTASGAGGVSVA